MNKFFFSTLAVLVIMMALYSSSYAQTKQEIQEKYTSFLQGKDISSKIDSDGDVQFKYKDRTYFIEADEKDPNYFRLVMANIWPIESEEERTQVLRAVDIANSKIKVAKIYMVRDNVWVGVEGFMSEPDDYEAYFDRCLNVIGECVKAFTEAMP